MYFQKNHSCSLLSSVTGGEGISTLTQINEDHKRNSSLITILIMSRSFSFNPLSPMLQYQTVS